MMNALIFDKANVRDFNVRPKYWSETFLSWYSTPHNRFTALFPDRPGEPVPEENFWTL